MVKALGYGDISLVPRYSELRSRSAADISVDFLGRRFKAPFVPANMPAVIDEKIAHWLSENDYFYIYHRFGDTEKFVRSANAANWKTISISIGVSEKDRDLILFFAMFGVRIDFITIDVAHGHHILVKEMIKYIRDTYDHFFLLVGAVCPKIIAGNVATYEAVRDLYSWKADGIKVGVAGGRACDTRGSTAFHVPMFSCARNCSIDPKIPLIIDGGVREPGDFSKALVACRDTEQAMAMAGSIFAACIDSPCENIYTKTYEDFQVGGVVSDGFGHITTSSVKLPVGQKLTNKRYYGSASKLNKEKSGQPIKHVEGFDIDIPCNGLTIAEKYEELSQALKSSISYAGGHNLDAFSKVSYIEV